MFFCSVLIYFREKLCIYMRIPCSALNRDVKACLRVSYHSRIYTSFPIKIIAGVT